MYFLILAYVVFAIIAVIRKAPKVKEPRTVKRLTVRDKRFSANSEFCSHCLTNYYFYRGGGSWAPDRCPYHPKSDDFILWKQMNKKQRDGAAEKFARMWEDMHGVKYTF
jgi:hypothetical protein